MDKKFTKKDGTHQIRRNHTTGRVEFAILFIQKIENATKELYSREEKMSKSISSCIAVGRQSSTSYVPYLSHSLLFCADEESD